MQKPSHRPSFRLRILPSPLARFFAIIPHLSFPSFDYAQKQIKDLLERVLDMDASKRSVSSRFLIITRTLIT